MGQKLHTIQLVADITSNRDKLQAMLGRWFYVQAATFEDIPGNFNNSLACVIDVNLTDKSTICMVRECISRHFGNGVLCFVINDRRSAETMQANALGASYIVYRDNLAQSLALFVKKLKERLMDGLWKDEPETTRKALGQVTALNDALQDCIARNEALPTGEVYKSTEFLITDIKEQSGGLDLWLNAVKQHHSYTYRHCTIVSGLAASFAVSLGVQMADVERLTTAALLHDVGKMKLPLGILDKPGGLTVKERALINKHPEYGAKILRRDGQFSDEVIELALHHHEFLDGTGYPDGLKGSEICDMTRILTIVDIFSALIDSRSYKEPMPASEAYEELIRMNEKLDQDIVKAFEPTASQADSFQLQEVANG